MTTRKPRRCVWVWGDVGEALSVSDLRICPRHEESKSVTTNSWVSELMQKELQGRCLVVSERRLDSV
jgi:hypothetical protein